VSQNLINNGISMRSNRMESILNPYARAGARKKLNGRKTNENQWTPLTDNDDNSGRLPRVEEVMVNELETADKVSPLSSRQSTKGSTQNRGNTRNVTTNERWQTISNKRNAATEAAQKTNTIGIKLVQIGNLTTQAILAISLRCCKRLTRTQLFCNTPKVP
jgi:uncharacterized alpha-E superfamily protein